ncbi:hypothetical protein ACN42_g3508 [Penicillium freii]|uniref:Uncharacterized protein n=1 Tax=Penicillium freii TaxID=48697 RepID=A0A101MN44_PENFR|nr:hypothetical protein ACN42_g3508 [Penicillium freii]
MSHWSRIGWGLSGRDQGTLCGCDDQLLYTEFNLPRDGFWLSNGQGSSHQSHENHVCYDNLLVFPNQNAKNACAAPHKNDMNIGPA